jgi:hypothetical protein
MKFPVSVLCIVLSAGSAQGAAAGRVGEAEVRATANGTPCFTIAEREEQRGGTPNFHSVTVSEGGAGRVVWTMAMPPDRTFPVTFSMCIPYAGRVQALPQTAAARLEPGKAYRVRIEARRGKGAPAPAAYEARFCLAPQRDGSTVVQQMAGAAGGKRDGCAGRGA